MEKSSTNTSRRMAVDGRNGTKRILKPAAIYESPCPSMTRRLEWDWSMWENHMACWQDKAGSFFLNMKKANSKCLVEIFCGFRSSIYDVFRPAVMVPSQTKSCDFLPGVCFTPASV